MNYSKRVYAVLLILLISVIPLTEGKENGKLNSGTGCGCHSQTGSNVATPSLSGTPAKYTPGQSYQLTISVSGGVSGSGGGFSLDIDKGTLSYIGFAVNINSAGDSATHSITGSSYRTWGLDWTAPNSGSGTVNFQLAAMTSNGDGSDSGDRWGTLTLQVPEDIPTNQPPSASGAMLSPTDAKTADSLTLSYSYSDPDGDSESGTVITWFKDGIALQQGAVPGKIVSSSLTSKNEQWYAEITPSDGQDSGSTITSNTVTIQNTPPSLSTPSISPSQPSSDEDLSFTINTNDEDQDSLSTEIRWFLNGQLMSELNDELTVPSLATRDGDDWYVEVRVSDDEETTVWKTSQTVTIGLGGPVNNQPTVDSISIQPLNPTTLDSLMLSFISNDVDGDTIVDSQIEWYLNGNLVNELTESTLPSQYTSKNQEWKAHVRVYDGTDWSQWTPSQLVTISNSKPIIEMVELDFSQTTTNQNISMNYLMTDADGDLPSPPDVKWFKNGVEQTSLQNQENLSSSLTSKGDNWTVFVKANDGQEFSIDSMSASVAISNSLPISVVELNHTPLQDMILTITNTDLDGDIVSNEVNWFRNGFKEGSLTGQLVVPSQLIGAGQAWSVEVIPNDGESNGTLVSSQLVVENLAPNAVIDLESVELWDNEEIVVTGKNSTDLDGFIDEYSWQWWDNNGNSGSGTGKTFSFSAMGDVMLRLIVEDEFGAIGDDSINFQTEAGPKVSQLVVEGQGEQVRLSWDWNGPNATFEIFRNGDSLSIISEYGFTDIPLLSGPTDYTVKPIIDDRTINSGAITVEGFIVDSIDPKSNDVSTTGGLITGILFITISFGTLVMAFVDRRD